MKKETRIKMLQEMYDRATDPAKIREEKRKEDIKSFQEERKSDTGYEE